MGNSFQISQSSHPTLITPFPAYVSFQGINLEKNFSINNFSSENRFTHKNLLDLMSFLSDEVLSNMYLIQEKHNFHLNKHVLNSDNLSDEAKDQKCREIFKRLFSALYATSLRHNKNEEYTKQTGSMYFNFLLFFCSNIMFTAVMVMCSIYLPLALASFLIITLKLSLDLKNKFADANKYYHDLYLSHIDDLNKDPIMMPPAQTPPCKLNSKKDGTPLRQLSTKKEQPPLPLTEENLLQLKRLQMQKNLKGSSDSLYSAGKTTVETPSSHGSSTLSQNHLLKQPQNPDSPITTSSSIDSEHSPTTSTDSFTDKVSSFSHFDKKAGPVPLVSSEKHRYNDSKSLPGPLPEQLHI